MKKLSLLAAVLAAGVGSAMAQAPAGAPAGATGICKDGTYWTGPSKSGACSGHKGVQTWYAAAPAAGASAPAPTPATANPPSAPAPTPAPAASAASAPATAGNGKKLSPAQTAAQKTAAPGGGKGLVWLNTSSNVYHCSDDPFYGKTKAGAYMTEDAAKGKGAHGDRGATCAGK